MLLDILENRPLLIGRDLQKMYGEREIIIANFPKSELLFCEHTQNSCTPTKFIPIHRRNPLQKFIDSCGINCEYI
jgi:hypothetical protein